MPTTMTLSYCNIGNRTFPLSPVTWKRFIYFELIEKGNALSQHWHNGSTSAADKSDEIIPKWLHHVCSFFFQHAIIDGELNKWGKFLIFKPVSDERFKNETKMTKKNHINYLHTFASLTNCEKIAFSIGCNAYEYIRLRRQWCSTSCLHGWATR